MNLVISAASGLIIILPFALLELINREPQQNFPFVLFSFLWILAAVFVFILNSLLMKKQDERNIVFSPWFFFRGILLILIAFIWIDVIIDQMPCFLGLPNCD
jgi:drug/metabolite transporter (DMT)-like permease